MVMFERNSQAEEVFSAAWQQVLNGRSVESVVAEHPECATELEEMLRVAASVRAAPGPTLSAQALARIDARTRAALRERRPVPISAATSAVHRQGERAVVVP